ncbi:MAG: TauD/TfdA family dioxygenase, partial [Novosphingobium sp.]|nr:TauD/TfdA family dioxygenase [Novosphingobium sp.]
MERIYTLPGAITVTRMQPAIGAVVSGVDLHQGFSDEQAESLRQALYSHGVIVLQGQQAMDFDDHLAFAKIYGEPVCEGPDPERPQITPVKCSAGSKDGTACSWHSDGCYQPAPPVASILRGIDPCSFGGDTCWSSGTAAYEGLADETKDTIADLKFSSSLAAVMPEDNDSFGSSEKWNELRDLYPTVHWPVVSVHPVTGARALYVNRTWSVDIVGKDEAESQALIGSLSDEFLRPEYQCRWQWQKGDVA